MDAVAPPPVDVTVPDAKLKFAKGNPVNLAEEKVDCNLWPCDPLPAFANTDWVYVVPDAKVIPFGESLLSI